MAALAAVVTPVAPAARTLDWLVAPVAMFARATTLAPVASLAYALDRLAAKVALPALAATLAFVARLAQVPVLVARGTFRHLLDFARHDSSLP